jgi:hypothetical protein
MGITGIPVSSLDVQQFIAEQVEKIRAAVPAPGDTPHDTFCL